MKSYGRILHDAPEREGYRDVWAVDCVPHVAERLKRWFKQVQAKRTGWIYLPDTREVARDLVWFTDRYPMEMSAEDRVVLEERAREYDEALATVERILSGERLEPAGGWLVPAVEPYPFQLVASDLILAFGRLLVMDDVGLGKTFTALLTLRNPDALPALVVCDTHLQRQWLQELGKFFPMLRGHIVRKRVVYDPSRYLHGHQPDVLICSYAKADAWADYLAGQVQTVIFDETQALRRDGSNKYVACARLADAARYVAGTTATPIYNYGGEIHNVFQAIKRDCLGSREEFVRAWGREAGNGRVFVRDPRALGTYLRDEGLAIRRTRKDVGMELPEVVRVPHDVDASHATFDHELAAGGTLALARMIVDGSGTREERFRASGEVDWQLRRATGLAKAPYVAAFIDLLLESEKKVLLAGWHRDVYAIWLERLAHHYPVMYTGSETVAGKDRSAQRFVEDESCRLMLMSLRSGAGLDGLQEACKVVVFGELDWSPGMHDQLIGRLNRDGMDTSEPVVAYFLTCGFGSDPVVMEALGVKRGQAEPIRDPDVTLFEQVEPAGDRIRLLAADVLRRHGKGR